ncbi:CaiB/BaiF CoA transferase family protein [Prauserella alba]|uniref:CoA transferase n=1 Tax=Prauserella alba TaxID=176898 RepID=A0ABN1VIM1_9PSEU|nr:CaiB/BaiF CoA-transferase family protein [Prauserella alba]MCP2182928.1 formyl-CoA transferase [Prauserella alba]
MDDSATSQSDSRPGPLAGITVLEMGNFIAAPSAGRLLADFGADVIKVERPGTGDELRSWRQYGADTSLLFRLLGRNKKSVTLDLRTEQGRDIALRLVARADVLLENFRPGTLERWGLGPDRLHEINPELVVTRVSGYGQTGPYRDQPGFGGVAEAVGGLRHLAGYPGMPPVRVGVSLADTVAGLYAVIGTLMTLLRRHRGGAGTEVVDVALYEAVYSLTESLVPEFEAFGVERGPSGSTIPGVVPSNSYPCADGKHIVIGGNNDGIFHRLMQLIERPDLACDPRLQDNPGRVTHVEEIDGAIARWTERRELAAALDELRAASVPCGPIYTARDIVDDPHYAARNMHEKHTVQLKDEQTGEISVPGIVPKLSGTPGGTKWLGPELGRHTTEVLGGIGIDESEQDSLRAAGVI